MDLTPRGQCDRLTSPASRSAPARDEKLPSCTTYPPRTADVAATDGAATDGVLGGGVATTGAAGGVATDCSAGGVATGVATGVVAGVVSSGGWRCGGLVGSVRSIS